MRPSSLSLALLLALFATGCPKEDTGDVPKRDRDEDGFKTPEDCDDENAEIHPAADEICDGVDNNCDGFTDGTDSLDPITWYEDDDGDGYGDPATKTVACILPDGAVTAGGDCDDANPSVNPGVIDLWYDGLDANCDYADDYDADADGDRPVIHGGGDCDDEDPTIYATAEETWYDGVDSNCDGLNDYDADQDRYEDAATGGFDCNDTDPTIYPGSIEIWYDGIDKDCYEDSDYDSDRDGDDALPWGDDCDDTTSEIHSDAEETCDNDDNDCDGDVDEKCELPLDWANTVYEGNEGSGQVGYAVSFGGDMDGDRRDEVLVAGPGDKSSGWNTGTVFLFGGEVTGDPLATEADALLYATADESFGYSLAAGQDVTGDDLPDVAIGALKNGTGATDAGGVWVVAGPVDGRFFVQPTTASLLYSDVNAESAGQTVAMGGDVTGDGAPDVLVGAPLSDAVASDNGAIWVYPGPVTGSALLSETAWSLQGDSGSRAGTGLAILGDLDGDGIDDIGVGAPYYSSHTGQVWVVLGPVSADLTLSSGADFTYTGENRRHECGSVVAGRADVTGDGYGDMLVGAPMSSDGGSNGGEVYVLAGPLTEDGDVYDASQAHITGDSNFKLGQSVSALDDMDADGIDEVLVGAPNASSKAGQVLIFRGPLDGSLDPEDADGRTTGLASNDQAGYAVAGNGDANGDGLGDVLIGAPGESTLDESAGMAYLVWGRLF